MPVLLLVRSTITQDREADFNYWYEREHCPKVLRFPGVLSAKRYRLIGENSFQYLVIYEFESEETLSHYMRSDHLEELKSDYDAAFGDVSNREMMAGAQIWEITP